MEPTGRYSFLWSDEQTTQFIHMRRENAHLFTGAKFSAQAAWKIILQKLGLNGKVTPLQAKRKWENLQRKYKDCKYPKNGEVVAGKATAETWPWFVPMDELLGQRAPEDTPGPSSAWQDYQKPLEEDLEEEEVEQQKLEQQKLEQQKLEQQKLEQQKLEQQKLEQQKLEQQKLEQQKLEQQKLKQQQEEDEQQHELQPWRRKRKQESELVRLYKEDLRMQWERDEREAEERKERFDRLFGLLEKLIDKN